MSRAMRASSRATTAASGAGLRTTAPPARSTRPISVHRHRQRRGERCDDGVDGRLVAVLGQHPGDGLVEVGGAQRTGTPISAASEQAPRLGPVGQRVLQLARGLAPSAGSVLHVRLVEGPPGGGGRGAGVRARRPAPADHLSGGGVAGGEGPALAVDCSTPSTGSTAADRACLLMGSTLIHAAWLRSPITRTSRRRPVRDASLRAMRDDLGADVPLTAPATPRRLARPVAHRGARHLGPGRARRRHRLVHPPRRPRRGPRPRHQEPRPRRDPRPLPRPRRRQQGGEPRARRTPAPRRRRHCLGHPDRDRQGVARLDVAALRRGPRPGRPAWLVEARRSGRRPPPPRLARRRPDLARPVDGRRRADLHRRPARPGRPDQRARRPRRALSDGHAGGHRGRPRGRRTAAGRALCLHRRRRPGGLHHPDAARVRAAADVVRPGDGRGARGAGANLQP